MTLLKHELSEGKQMLFIWTAIIAGMFGVCIFVYPEMKTQMEDISGMFSNLGSFSAAFGMDKINFGEFLGFFSVECGNILGLGGSFFAALIGISSLAKEEKEQTAEFLLTHPIKRSSVVLQKFCALILQIFSLNIVVILVTVLSISAIGETPDAKTLSLMFLAYFILQIETASVCFCCSSFLNRKGLGGGLGVAALFYFINILSNLTEKMSFLKFITPFSYVEGSNIISEGGINFSYLSVGFIITALSIITAFYQYQKKDIE